jgi:hypothetical protein
VLSFVSPFTDVFLQPSQVGVSLPNIGFNAFFETTGLGPITSTGAVNLLPFTTSALALAGRLVPQTSSSGLAAVSTVFNNFIHGQNSNVTVQGTAAGPSSVCDQSCCQIGFSNVVRNTGYLAQ